MTEITKHKVIGLIGMSGAGKSTVGRVFSEKGFCWIDCDRIARSVTAAGSPFLKELSERFSAELILPDGTLDRQKTAAVIFSDSEKRCQYNKIIYPYITYNIIEKIKQTDCDILLDAPTLFDARLEGICTHIVSVCADEGECIKRIMLRDGISEAAAKARLSSQHNADYYRQRSDYCLENNGTEQELYSAAEKTAELLKGDT